LDSCISNNGGGVNGSGLEDETTGWLSQAGVRLSALCFIAEGLGYNPKEITTQSKSPYYTSTCICVRRMGIIDIDHEKYPELYYSKNIRHTK
jgi:hypothetical protein